MVRNNARFDLMIMVSVIGIITGKVQIEGNNVWYRWRGLPLDKNKKIHRLLCAALFYLFYIFAMLLNYLRDDSISRYVVF